MQMNITHDQTWTCADMKGVPNASCSSPEFLWVEDSRECQVLNLPEMTNKSDKTQFLLLLEDLHG